MSIDARAFRQTVGQFVTGVTVVAADVDGAVRAMTANSFTSVSLDPPLVLFCVGKTAAPRPAHPRRDRLLRQHPSARTTAPLHLFRRRLETRGAAAVHLHSLGRRSAARWLAGCARMQYRGDPRRRRSLDRHRQGVVALPKRIDHAAGVPGWALHCPRLTRDHLIRRTNLREHRAQVFPLCPVARWVRSPSAASPAG